MDDEIPWVIQEQTKVKHELLNRYISPWMAILFRAQASYGRPQRLMFVDGFSGPGEYWADESKTSFVPGSPIIVAEIANRHIEQDGNRKVDIVAIDHEKKCVERLKPLIEKSNTKKQNWVAMQVSFEAAIKELVEDKTAGYFQNPAFVFIDPFGYSGFPLDSLKKILVYPRTELFINFMISFIVRFINEPHAQNILKALYGGNDYLQAVKIEDPDKKCEFLINLYCQKLREQCGALYTLPFRINTPGKGTRPLYYLIHVSTNIKALKVMKDEMAKTSHDEFSFVAIGLNEDNQISLFRNPLEEEIENKLLKFVQDNQRVMYEQLEDWAYVYTPAVSKKIKELLVKLEREDKITITRKPKAKKKTVTEGAIITVKVKS